MAKNASRKKRYNSSRIIVMTAIFVGTITTTLLSFISVELALLSFGIFALTSLTYAENRRRSLWERAASFKFKTLEAGQKTLSKEVILNTNDIDAIKRDMKNLSRPSKAEPQEDVDTAPVKSSSRYMPSGAPSFDMDTASPKNSLANNPRAAKPQLPDTMPDTTKGEEKFEDLSDTIVRELVHHAMAEKRVDVFVQPIVRLPQRQVRFYEMFSRIRARPGQYLPASRYMEIAEQDNLDQDIDTLLLLHCLKTIQASAHIERATPFFINIKRSTLKNSPFMKRLLAFVSKNRDLAPRLVFEMQYQDFDTLPKAMLEIVRGLGTLGCRFSLDHVESLQMDIADLQHFKIRFVKINAQKLLNQGSEKAFAELHKRKRKLEANGIGVIVEKIEDENAMRELLDFDVHYGQGYLFGKPELEGAYKKGAKATRKGFQEDVA